MVRLPAFDAVLVFVGCVSFLGVLLLLAALSPVAAIVAIGFAGLLALIVSLGLVRTATAIILLAMFFAPLNNVRPSSAVSFVTAADLLFVLGFVLLAPVIVFRRVSPPLIFILGSVILLSTGLLASLGSFDPGVSVNHMARLVVSALGLPVAFMFWRPDKRLVAILAGAYVAGQVYSIGYALFAGGAEGGRYAGLATHANFFGLSSLLAASLVPYVASLTPPSQRWMPWAAGVVCLYGIWISGSRAALLVILLIAVIYPLLERSVKAAGLLAFAGAGVMIAAGRLFDDSGDNALSRLLGGGHASYSDVSREQAMTVAIRSFEAHPLLGTGFINPLAAHNIYLEIVVAVGLSGLVGYGFILWSGVSGLFTLTKPFNQLAYPIFAYAAIGSITNALWDRFIWAALSLSLIAHLLAADEKVVEEDTFVPKNRELVEEKV